MADPDAKTAVQPQIETAKPGAFTPPRVIGPFELIKLLGRGGMAAVFEARHVKTKEKVALKVMDPNLRSDRTFVERFLQEVKACAAMEHPHVVKVLDHGESDGWYFLATELIDGGTVADLINQMKQLPAALAAELGAQLLDGLAYAHAQGIVHRDLKPENLLLTRSGALKVADFGIARTADHTKLTKTGMLVGTAGYMSPEQAKGSPVDGRSDLFTVGIIFYEMLTGTNPFESDNPAASITRIIEQDVPPLFELRPTVPAELEAVVDRLLAGNPEERYDGAASAAAALLPSLNPEGPKLVADSIADPAAAKLKLDREQAAALLSEAKMSSQSNTLDASRAALKLYVATLLDAQNAEARARLDELSAKMKLRFSPSDNAKVKELEGLLSFTPKNPMLLAQLANLHRLEGNLVRSASYLKRYLKLKPNDVYLSGQLSQLTGEKRGRVEKDAAAPARAPRPPVPGVVQPSPSPAPEAPPSNRSASEAGIFISRVEVESTWLRAAKKLAPWLAVLAVALLGWTWVSRQLDAAARNSEKQADFIRKRLTPVAIGPDGRFHDPAEATADFDEAMRLEQLRDYPHAFLAYDALMKAHPTKLDTERAAFRRAKMLQAMAHFGDAREAYGQFLALHPGSLDAAEALMRRGECAAVLEDPNAAEQDFGDFLARHPSSPLVLENWVLRGELRARQRDFAGARADFRQVLDRLEPASPLARRAQAGLEALGSK